ncbi:MAG: Eco57I restriction-modification methylase domain-containing protein [Candidatus Hodarchaeales archaeon]|jgi:adenine-specific DNA-methyltransferase
MSSLKAAGQYFTPRFVAEFMVSLIQREKSVRILEPSAGQGIFLDVLWKKGFRNLQAYEIDPSLPNESPVEIIYQDFLTAENLPSPDIIIGNPPYVRWKNLPQKERERFKNDPKWKGIVNGLSDLSYAFIHRCVDVLKPGGELIFLTPYFWTETLHSSNIRRKMAKSGELATFINFHEMKIFSTVSLNAIIFKFLKSHSNRQIKAIQVWSKANLTKNYISRIQKSLQELELSDDYISDGEIKGYLHPQFKGRSPWKFLSPLVRQRLQATEKACIQNSPFVRVLTGQKVSMTHLYDDNDVEQLNIPQEMLIQTKFRRKKYWMPKESSRMLDSFLGDNYAKTTSHSSEFPKRFIRLGDLAEIGNGMVSGLDRAFRLSKNFKLSPKEKGLVIPVIKAKSLHQFYHDSITLYAFPNGISSEKELKKHYPNIFEQIKKFKEQLLKRYDYNREIPWWEWVFLRNKSLFEQYPRKIFVPCKERFDKRGHVRFAYVEGTIFATQDVTAIAKSELFKEDEKYLLAVLNSELAFEWMKHKGLTRGGVLEFSEQPLTRIPIRLIDWDDNEEIILHNAIVKLVDRILAARHVEPYKSQIEGKIKALYDESFLE